MASVDEVAQVRLNTGQSADAEPYTDVYIGGLIDGGTVSSATLVVWRSLAATYASMVNVTEAGASHSFSDLFKNASAMVAQWERIVAAEGEAPTATTSPRVTAIERST